MSKTKDTLPKFIAFAAILQASVINKQPFNFYNTLLVTELRHLNNGCKAIKKILVEQENIIKLSKDGVPEWNKQIPDNLHDLGLILQSLTTNYSEAYKSKIKHLTVKEQAVITNLRIEINEKEYLIKIHKKEISKLNREIGTHNFQIKNIQNHVKTNRTT